MLSHSGHVMTLANAIIGVGILAMPFCFQKCGIVLAIVLLIVSNWITRICCHYLIKCSLLTRRKSFEFLGFHAFGSSGKLLVELCIIGYLLGTCITYFVVVGDLGPQIVTKMFALNDGHIHLRIIVMIAVTLVCILPLGMLKNVDSLSAVCTASVGFYVCLIIKIILESKEHIIDNDWSDKVLYWEPAGVLQCLPIFSMALSCQMQLFEVFESISNQSLEKLNGVVKNATWICTLVYIAMGLFGYIAFCTQTFSGNILLNFKPSFGSDAIKIGFVLSIAFSFPLVIFPCRASIYSLLYRRGHSDASGYIPEARFKIITIIIVLLSLCIALMIPSVELIIGLVGSTIGVAICIMFPASCFRKICKKPSTERSLAQLILVCGFFLMILGTFANLTAIDEKSSGAHLDQSNNLLNDDQVKQNILLIDLFKENEIEKAKNSLLAAELKDVKNDITQIDKSGDDDEKKTQPKDEIQNEVEMKIKSQPPLPVDEQHEENVEVIEQNEDKKIVVNESSDDNKIKSKDVIKPPEIKKAQIMTSINSAIPPKTIEKPPSKINEKSESQPQLVIKPNDKLQTINQDAIKKENDEIAATDIKNNLNNIKITEKIIKNNVNDKNLTLNITQERQKQQKHDDASLSLKETANSFYNKTKNIANGTLNKQQVDRIDTQVYEPLSYKTGELVEHLKNITKGEPLLPLPLALLRNSTMKKNDIPIIPIADDDKSYDKNSNIKKFDVKYEPIDDIDIDKLNDKKLQANISNNFVNNNAQELDKENVEAIRREILQVDEENKIKLDTMAAKKQNNIDDNDDNDKLETLERQKRSQNSKNDDDDKNCPLKEPKLDKLLTQLNSNNLLNGMELNSIGRSLKSIKTDENK